MTSANSQTIEALEEVLTTVQNELARLRRHDEVLSAASIPPPPIASQRPTFSPPVTEQAVPGMAPPPPPRPPAPGRSSTVVAPRTGPTRWRRPQSATVNSPKLSISPELAFRFGGISLVVLSAIFFVSTAINREWIGPTAQLVLATAVSLGFIAQSFRFDADHWRVTFASGGAAGLFVSGVVGHLGLDVLSMPVVAGWLAVTVAAFLGLARIHDSQVLAALAAPASLIGTLLLAASGIDSPALIAAAGALWASLLAAACHGQRWPIARSAGAVVAGMIVTGGAAAGDLGLFAPATIAVLAGLASIGYLAWQQATSVRRQQTGQVSTLSAFEARVFALFIPWVAITVSALLNGAQLLGRNGDDLTGWATIAVGLLGGGVVALSPARVDRLMVTLHQLAGIGIAVVGLTLLVEGPALVAGLLAAAVVSAALAHQTAMIEALGLAGLFGAIVAVWTLGILVDGITDDGLRVGEAITTGLVLATSFGALWLARQRDEVLLIGAWVGWAATLMWVAAVLQPVPQAQMWISISWVALSVGLLMSRTFWSGELATAQFANIVNIALATFALTGCKLVFVDLGAVDILWRAALFFVIGGTFLRLAFVLPGLLGRHESDDSEAVSRQETEASQHSPV